MSEHKFYCPACGQKIACDSSVIGRVISCPVCQTAFVVPIQSVAAATVPPAVAPAAPVAAQPPPIPAPPSAAPVFQPPPARPPQSTAAKAAALGVKVQQGKNYCGLAKASLISSVVMGIGWLPGIIFGHMARARIRKNPLLDGNGMAMAGLAISYVTMFFLLCGATAFALHGRAMKPVVVVRSTSAQLADLSRRTVDEVVVADRASELAHGISQSTGNTQRPTGYEGTNRWRGAQGRDAFAYVLDVLPDRPMTLNCRFKDDANQRLFDVIVNDQLVGEEVFQFNVPGHYYDVEYPIPAELTRDKKEINVVFRSQDSKVMGKLYALQTLKP